MEETGLLNPVAFSCIGRRIEVLPTVAVRTEDLALFHLVPDRRFGIAVRDHGSDAQCLLRDVVELEATRVTLLTLSTSSLSLVRSSPRSETVLFRSLFAGGFDSGRVFASVAVRTEEDALLDLGTDIRPRVAVGDHLVHSHLLLLSLTMMEVETDWSGHVTPRTAVTLAFDLVDPATERRTSFERPFGVPFPVPVVPALVDGKRLPGVVDVGREVVGLGADAGPGGGVCVESGSFFRVVPATHRPHDGGRCWTQSELLVGGFRGGFIEALRSRLEGFDAG